MRLSIFLALAFASLGTSGCTMGSDSKSNLPGNAHPEIFDGWAKLYPGAKVLHNRTNVVMDRTDWNVSYSVSDSPEKVADFYRKIADANGYNKRETLGFVHLFTQESSGNRFSYGLVKLGSTTGVTYDARTSAH